MEQERRTTCECFNETDRMVNEGLGNGTIIPKYEKVHAQLKEKETLLFLSALHEQNLENGGK